MKRIKIDSFNEDIYREIKTRWDKVAKPLDSLGKFEDIIARIGAVQGIAEPDISRRAVVIMCADNGIVEEGVSQSGQDVTREVASWMGRGCSSVCKMAAAARVETLPVDIGINMEGSPEGVIDMKVRKGTSDFAKGAAMTIQEASQAVKNGTEIVRLCSEEGCRLLATGEMGIGNTTTSSALVSALLGIPAEEATGRGAGLSNEGLKKKTEVIGNAVSCLVSDWEEQHAGKDRKGAEFAFHALCAVGGLDIAGMAGMFIGGAVYHVPIVIDGFISAAAALVAERICPGCREVMIASHIGREPGMKMILDELGLEPVIDADLALGEGTGAVMLFPLLDLAMTLYSDGLEFSETGVEQYVHFTDGDQEKD
ncbi:MAG: nicotinate-nucleotide--dimethylbenzimidazole phosphoribosyltransferase [Mogibacterium sp.]|nr:nicotinate-nucleotide--dimethylbenzimidazole phosphoribosyltransferase [Mogibacterium sp.]